MWYCEYALQPFKRNGTMIPVSALPTLYDRVDAGYSSYYWFSEADAQTISKQGSSKDLARFPVYTRYLVLDIDREDKPDQAHTDMQTYTQQIVEMGLRHSVWVSGGKGYHIYIHCEPDYGTHVPYSQLQWVKTRGWNVDLYLYQHGRLLSNPGRKSVKTGIRKHRILEVDGQLLSVPKVQPPQKVEPPTEIGDADRARIALYRMQKALESQPSSRHTTLWSLAGACREAGISQTLCVELLEWINQFWTNPKDHAGLQRAVQQAYPTQMSPSPSSTKVAGHLPTSEASSVVLSVDYSLGGPAASLPLMPHESRSRAQPRQESQLNVLECGINVLSAATSGRPP